MWSRLASCKWKSREGERESKTISIRINIYSNKLHFGNFASFRLLFFTLSLPPCLPPRPSLSNEILFYARNVFNVFVWMASRLKAVAGRWNPCMRLSLYVCNVYNYAYSVPNAKEKINAKHTHTHVQFNCIQTLKLNLGESGILSPHKTQNEQKKNKHNSTISHKWKTKATGMCVSEAQTKRKRDRVKESANATDF